MTITDITTTTDAEAGGQIEVDPAKLFLGPNVRPAVRLNKSFVASIRERGVLEPVVTYRGDDGTLVVLLTNIPRVP